VGRANQFNSGGGIFHLTHRCHNRAFLLKFARDRDGYREMLRGQLGEFKVCLLDYCLTSNHVHLLLEAEDRLQISALMRNVAGEFARAYNRRKERENAFWGDYFHATLVEEGRYLWRCLCYVELNMVRCRQPPKRMGMGRLSGDHGNAATVSIAGFGPAVLAIGER